MSNNVSARSDDRWKDNCPYTSVVVLHWESPGVVHACPVTGIGLPGNRISPALLATGQLPSCVVVLSISYRQPARSAASYLIRPEHGQGMGDMPKAEVAGQIDKKGHAGNEPDAHKLLKPVMATGVTSAKTVKNMLGLSLAAGGILLTANQKTDHNNRLLGLAAGIGGLIIFLSSCFERK